MKAIVNIIIRKLKKFIRLASPEGELVSYGDKNKLHAGQTVGTAGRTV